MAGLGFKDFAVGEVLTAADVDGYLMQQSVMRFADAGARGSALGTATGTAVPLAEGMVSYLDDINDVQVYGGSAWSSVIGLKQVYSTLETGTFTTTSATYVDITDSDITLTPQSSTSKFIVLGSVGYVDQTESNPQIGLRVVRDATSIAGESRVTAFFGSNFPLSSLSVSCVDSPATTSSITYKLQGAKLTDTATVRFTNRSLIIVEFDR